MPPKTKTAKAKAPASNKPRATPRSPGKAPSERQVQQLERQLAAREAAPAGKTSKGSNGQTSNRSDGQMMLGSEVVERKGYLRADGSRSGARGHVRRMTVYFPLGLGKQLAVQAALAGRDMSDILSEALTDWMRNRGIEVEVEP